MAHPPQTAGSAAHSDVRIAEGAVSLLPIASIVDILGLFLIILGLPIYG
jgi:hypothetical protein